MLGPPLKDSDANATCRPNQLAHIVLQTKRLPELQAFFEQFLGARVAYENPRAVFMQYDDEHHRIAIFQMDDLKEKSLQRSGVNHVAFAYDTLDRMLGAYTQRKSKGLLPYWCTNHGMSISMYYADPDGNVYENQVDCFKTAEEAHEYMQTEDFLTNPIGVDFDPDDVAARLAKGESHESICKRKEIGHRGPETVPSIPGPFENEKIAI